MPGLLDEGFEDTPLRGLLDVAMDAIDEGRARYGGRRRPLPKLADTARGKVAQLEEGLQYLLGPHVTAGVSAARQALAPDLGGLVNTAASAGAHFLDGEFAQGAAQTAELPLSAALELAPGPNPAHVAAPAFGAMARHVLPDDFPKIPFATNLRAVKGHTDYAAAKRGGDVRAADNLVRALFKPEKLGPLKERLEGRAPLVTPVVLMEDGTKDMNMIPMALAKQVADALGGGVTRRVVQTNRTGHTGAGMDARFLKVPEFTGAIDPSAPHIVVDDVVTGGSTLAELIGHIMDGGGTVAGAHTLAGTFGSSKLRPDAKTLDALRMAHGQTENEWREIFGYGFDALTDREAHTLRRLKPDGVRDLLAARRK